MKKYGIFGGTFNPPHIAHSIVADSVREQLQLDRIIFIPAGNPPLKDSLPGEHRFEMAKLAFGKDKNFEVSGIEFENLNVKSYTADTLSKLRDKFINDSVKLFLIIGMDQLKDLPKWKDPEKLFELSEVVVINRPGFKIKDSKPEFSERVVYADVPFLEISSSEIREKISCGISVKYFLDREVHEYILKNGLYLKK